MKQYIDFHSIRMFYMKMQSSCNRRQNRGLKRRLGQVLHVMEYGISQAWSVTGASAGPQSHPFQ